MTCSGLSRSWVRAPFLSFRFMFLPMKGHAPSVGVKRALAPGLGDIFCCGVLCLSHSMCLMMLAHNLGPGDCAVVVEVVVQRWPAVPSIPCLLLCAVMSSQEDRDAMVACLQLGAADYMIKPLRHNELRNLWARVYWWRRVSGSAKLHCETLCPQCSAGFHDMAGHSRSVRCNLVRRPSTCSSRRRWSWAPRSTPCLA